MDTIGQQGHSLFSSSLEDLRDAFRSHSTQNQFGRLTRLFFADFLSRTVRALVDRELSHHVGPSHQIASVEQSTEFMNALDLYARQSSRIMEDFAAAWYSKRNWEANDQITQEEAQGFVAVALRKLRHELKLEAATP
jgi:hypothetical protein